MELQCIQTLGVCNMQVKVHLLKSQFSIFCSQNKIFQTVSIYVHNKKQALPLRRLTQARKFHFYEKAELPLRVSGWNLKTARDRIVTRTSLTMAL